MLVIDTLSCSGQIQMTIFEKYFMKYSFDFVCGRRARVLCAFTRMTEWKLSRVCKFWRGHCCLFWKCFSICDSIRISWWCLPLPSLAVYLRQPKNLHHCHLCIHKLVLLRAIFDSNLSSLGLSNIAMHCRLCAHKSTAFKATFDPGLTPNCLPCLYFSMY